MEEEEAVKAIEDKPEVTDTEVPAENMPAQDY